MNALNSDEHIEYIDGRLKLIVSGSHTFGTDALLLSAFSAPKMKDRVCDFGTGCGIIPFYWLSHGKDRVNAVEIQEKAVNQLRRSIEMNGLEDRFNLIYGDLRDSGLPKGSFDLITMNPPYTPIGKGIISSAASDKIARHESSLSLDELFLSASKLLKFGGRMCICLRPERLTEAMCSMRTAKIEPKRLRFVSKREGCAPWLFLLEGKLGRNPGITVEKELHIYDASGNESAEMTNIIGAYKKG